MGLFMLPITNSPFSQCRPQKDFEHSRPALRHDRDVPANLSFMVLQ